MFTAIRIGLNKEAKRLEARDFPLQHQRVGDGGWYLHRALQQLSLTLPKKVPSFTAQSFLTDLQEVAHQDTNRRLEGSQSLSLHTCSASDE